MNAIPTDEHHYFTCQKCKVIVTWPASLSPEDKSRIASEMRSSRLAGHKLLVTQFGFTTNEAKALTHHVTRTKGQCHRCRRLVQGEVTICDTCRSANLDW